MKTKDNNKLSQADRDKITKLVEEIGFENDEGKLVKAEVDFDWPWVDETIYFSIRDWQTSRGSGMAYMFDHWMFNKNFWLTQRNLKLLNAINDILMVYN